MHSYQFCDLTFIEKKNRKENYAGSKTFPASNKEKETHWPEVP